MLSKPLREPGTLLPAPAPPFWETLLLGNQHSLYLAPPLSDPAMAPFLKSTVARPWALPRLRPSARYTPETSVGSCTGSIVQKQSFPAADWRQGSLGFISLLSTASFTKTKPSWEPEPVWLASPCHLGLTIHHYFQSRLLRVCSRELPHALCLTYFEPFVVGHTLLTGISFGSPFCRLQPSSRLPVCSSDGLPGMDGRAEELGPHSRDGFRAFSDLPSGTSLWPPPLPLARRSGWVNMTSDSFGPRRNEAVATRTGQMNGDGLQAAHLAAKT